MALSRKLLKGMGLTEEQIDSIIEAHTDTVDGLKDTIAQLRQGGAQAPAKPAAKDSGGDAAKDSGYRKKYEDEHQAFEDFKKAQAARDARAARESACRKALREVGVSEKYLDKILALCDVDSLELDDKGALKDADKIKEGYKTDWADFISVRTTKGVATAEPPANTGAKKTMTREEIIDIKDPEARQAAIAENPELFGIERKE